MTKNISNEFLMELKERQQDIMSDAVDSTCRYCIREDCDGCFVQELKDEAMKEELVATPWKNFGSVNFLAYGGCLVRRHFTEMPEAQELVFDMFYLSPKYGGDNNVNFAVLCCIDLTVSWLPWKKMFTRCGDDKDAGVPVTELVKKYDPMLLAKNMVLYAGFSNFSPSVCKNGLYNNMHPSNVEDFLVSNDDVVKWLHSLGAENIIDEQKELEETDEPEEPVKTEDTVASESCCENESLTVGDIVNNSKFDFNANFAVYLCDKDVTWDQAGEPAFSTGVKESENKVPIEELYDCKVVYMTISNHDLIIEAAKKEMNNNAVAAYEMTTTEAKEVITEYVFSDYKLESLYPIVDKKFPDTDERNRKLYAESFLTDALQKAVIALGRNEESSKDCGC